MKKDIILEYETHFISGKQDGKCEEEIARKLGNPKMIEKNVSYAISNADKKRSFKNMITALFSVMSLSALNFAFIFVAFFTLFITFSSSTDHCHSSINYFTYFINRIRIL